MLSTQWLSSPRNSTRVVLVHGFTQNARCWGAFGDALAESFEVLAVDAPGHGWSGEDNAKLSEAGDLLLSAGERGHFVGYSMGGRMMLHAALNNPQSNIKSLVLIGAHGGIEVDEERRQRKQADAALADRIAQLGTRAFVDEWLSQPMFADLTDDQSGKALRYENSPEGLAGSVRNLSLIHI